MGLVTGTGIAALSVWPATACMPDYSGSLIITERVRAPGSRMASRFASRPQIGFVVLRCTCGGHLEVVPSFTEMAMLMRTAFINRISVEVSVRPDVPQAPFCAAAAGDQGFRAWSRGSWNSALRFLNGCVARHAAAGEFQAGTAWPAVGLSSNPSDTGVTRRDMDVASGVAGRK